MLAAMDSAKRFFLGSLLLCLALPLGAASLPCRPCAGLRVDSSASTAGPADAARLLKPGGLEPGSPVFVAWEVPLSGNAPENTPENPDRHQPAGHGPRQRRDPLDLLRLPHPAAARAGGRAPPGRAPRRGRRGGEGARRHLVPGRLAAGDGGLLPLRVRLPPQAGRRGADRRPGAGEGRLGSAPGRSQGPPGALRRGGGRLPGGRGPPAGRAGGAQGGGRGDPEPRSRTADRPRRPPDPRGAQRDAGGRGPRLHAGDRPHAVRLAGPGGGAARARALAAVPPRPANSRGTSPGIPAPPPPAPRRRGRSCAARTWGCG